jgi:hypothetical protein
MIKPCVIIFLIIAITTPATISSKTSPDRIKGWLQLDEIKQKMNANIAKYTQIDAQLKQETNEILQESIDAADELAQDDPTAAYALYHDMKKLVNATIATSLDIAAINKKFKELSDYVDQQIKELCTIRRKHLQFPY